MSEVIVDQAILNYDIQKKIQFDIGKMILNCMWDKRKGKHSLGYPFLIFKLCAKAGVKSKKTKDMLPLYRELIIRQDLQQKLKRHQPLHQNLKKTMMMKRIMMLMKTNGRKSIKASYFLRRKMLKFFPAKIKSYTSYGRFDLTKLGRLLPPLLPHPLMTITLQEVITSDHH